VLLLAAGALASCGDDDRPASAPRAEPVGQESQGSVVQYADCGDWRGGTPAEKRATVVALRGQLTPQSSETATSPLPDDRAYAVLESACAPGNPASLRLYKLYVRAQAFAPLG
jgi:hypothetical protein